MSIMRMRRMFSRQRKIKVGKKRINMPSIMAVVFGLLVIIFIIGAFWSFGNPGRGAGGTASQHGKGPGTVVGKVGGQPVTKGQIDMTVEQQGSMFGGPIPIAMQASTRLDAFNQIANQILLLQAAKREGVGVSRADMDKEINDQVEQQISQRFPTQEALFKYLQTKNISRDQLVNEIRQKLAANPEGMRESLQVKKLQEKVESGVQVSDEQVKNWYTEVKVSHILIDPKQVMAASAKPAAPGQPPPQPLTAAQADEQAKQKAESLLAQIKSGADFAKLAQENSDDPGSKDKGGDLGWVKHGQMVPEFEQAAFALKPGEVSGVIKTQFGYHIIKVFDMRSTLPQDFDKNKAMYKNQVLEQMKQAAWQAYQSKLKEGAQIQILDPGLRAMQALQQGRQEEAQTLLAQAAQEDPTDLASRWQLAQMMIRAQNWAPAINYLEEITKQESGASDPQVWLALGDAYEKAGQAKEALDAYTSASDRAGATNFSNMMIHTQLKQKFTELKHDDLVKQEEKWLADFQEQQKKQGGPAGLPGGTFTIP
jgi:parvulin-like peptidyl-prolyl isomerase